MAKTTYEVEYSEDSETFEILGPEKPYRTGGTVRDIVSSFEEEGNAIEVCKELNRLLALSEAAEKVIAARDSMYSTFSKYGEYKKALEEYESLKSKKV